MRWLLIACVLCVSTEALAKKHKPKGKQKHSAPEKKKEPEKKVESKPSKKEKSETKAAAAAPAPEINRETIKRESKIEFDERVVQGQRAQGAVYLFQRAETQFTSLVQTPDSFRYRTTQQVFGEQ